MAPAITPAPVPASSAALPSNQMRRSWSATTAPSNVRVSGGVAAVTAPSSSAVRSQTPVGAGAGAAAAHTSSSAAALIASAMSSAPILEANGRLAPNNGAAPAPKTKNASSTNSGAGANRPTGAASVPLRLEDVKVADLKAECRKRKLVVSGPKPNLVERLRPYADDVLRCLEVNMRATTTAKEASTSSSSDETTSSVENVVEFCPTAALDVVKSEAERTETSAPESSADGAGGRPRFCSFEKAVPPCAVVRPCPSVASQSSRFGAKTTPPTLSPGLASQKTGSGLTPVPLSADSSFAFPSSSSASSVPRSAPLMNWYRPPPPLSIPSLPPAVPSSRVPPLHLASPSIALSLPPFQSPPSSFSAHNFPASHHHHPPGMSSQPAQPLTLSGPPRIQIFRTAPVSATNPNPSESGAMFCDSDVLDGANGRDDGFGLQSPVFDGAVLREDVSLAAAVKFGAGASEGVGRFGGGGVIRMNLLSSNDILSWQQEQIRELQKQLHLSRMQLLETHRRAWQQQEQYRGTMTAATSSFSAVGGAGAGALGVFDRNQVPSPAPGNGAADSIRLLNIPRTAAEPIGCDLEMFDDLNISPFSAGAKSMEDDNNDAEELEALQESCVETRLPSGADGSDHVIPSSYLSPGIHSAPELSTIIPEMNATNDNETEVKSETSSFFLSVPMKEPPQYDEVMKEKQTSSSSTIAAANSSVDEILQMIMRQRDITVNAVSNNNGDHVKSSDNVVAITTNASPLNNNNDDNRFTSPFSHDAATTHELDDVYPYSAASTNSSSSGVGTAPPSTCSDLTTDPLSAAAAGLSSLASSDVPFQLPDWTDSEFLELSMLGRMRLEFYGGGSSSQRTTPELVFPFPSSSSSSNDYDPCLAGFGPPFAGDGFGMADLDLLETGGVPGGGLLPPLDEMSRSYDVMDDLFAME